MAVLEYLGPARAGLLISPGPGPPSQTGKNQGEFAGATDEPEKDVGRWRSQLWDRLHQ